MRGSLHPTEIPRNVSKISEDNFAEAISTSGDPSIFASVAGIPATSDRNIKNGPNLLNQPNVWSPPLQSENQEYLVHSSHTWKPGGIEALKVSSPTVKQCKNGDWSCPSRTDSTRQSRIKSDDGARRLAK